MVTQDMPPHAIASCPQLNNSINVRCLLSVAFHLQLDVPRLKLQPKNRFLRSSD